MIGLLAFLLYMLVAAMWLSPKGVGIWLAKVKKEYDNQMKED